MNNKKMLAESSNWFVSGLLGLVILLIYIISPESNSKDFIFYESIFFIYLGSLFVFSFLDEKRLYINQGLMWLCCHLSFPQTRYMALVYATIFYLFACYDFYKWMFIQDA